MSFYVSIPIRRTGTGSGTPAVRVEGRESAVAWAGPGVPVPHADALSRKQLSFPVLVKAKFINLFDYSESFRGGFSIYIVGSAAWTCDLSVTCEIETCTFLVLVSREAHAWRPLGKTTEWSAGQLVVMDTRLA